MSAKTAVVKEDQLKRTIGRNNIQVATAQQLFSSDPKYKKYTQQVEKCLNAFDNVHEWADCIAFLKKLLKTFQSHPQFQEIPCKLIVAKRLARCLNPALPTGVHQRALDVYTHVLSVLGTEGLKRDLPLWSSGLFPFFEYASTSVKPTLLNIYDTYYLPLQHDLRPVMKSFILALLPGLEEETSEFFDKVPGLLDRLSGTVSPVFFIQNVWLVMITMSSARGTAPNFLSRRLPRLHADEGITLIVERDIGLMIRAFAAALEDDNFLVRRSALGILLQTMRIDSAAIKRAKPEDAAILTKAAISVVLRRDLSLNRRLYTWLLGPDEKTEVQSAYLRQHALQLLSSTLKSEMFTPCGEYFSSRPFKIFISLLDKWEIGSPLTDALIYDALMAIRQYLTAESETREDVTMTASTPLEAAEPSILWKHLLQGILNAINSSEQPLEAITAIPSPLSPHARRGSEEHSSTCDFRRFDGDTTSFSSTLYGLEVPASVSYNHLATPLVSVVEEFSFLRTSYLRVLLLLGKLIEFTEKASDASLEISWNPLSWTQLQFQDIDFNLVDSCISILISLQQSSEIVPKFVPDQKQVISWMVKKLFGFLHQNWAIFHVHAVSLTWTLESSTGHHLVESIIAQMFSNIMTSSNISGDLQTGPPSALPPFQSRIDEYMSEHYPHLRYFQTPPELLKACFKMWGATDDNLYEHLERHNKHWDEIIANSPNGRLIVIGEKPQSDGNEQVLYLQIPDSKLAIRIWPGGMQYHAGYCLDLFDITQKTSMDTPDDFEFRHISRPDGPGGMKLLSLRKVFDVPACHIQPGNETYVVLEGSRIVLVRPGKAPFYFEIPSMPMETGGVPFPQPQATLPVLN
ncbi:Dopey, N-terminal-domain-containing protein [Boletus coccyginus]|nr:Dopey, N-terminal-domain-containing protein [Boletus coccyginus]